MNNDICPPGTLEILKQLKASGGMKCPNCYDVGYVPLQVSEDEWEQVQCEFCYTVKDSVFNRNQGKNDGK